MGGVKIRDFFVGELYIHPETNSLHLQGSRLSKRKKSSEPGAFVVSFREGHQSRLCLFWVIPTSPPKNIRVESMTDLFQRNISCLVKYP